MTRGPRAGDDQFHGRRRQHPRRLQGRADRHHPVVAHLHREGQARQRWSPRSRKRSSSSISKTFAPPSPPATRSAACSIAKQAAGRAQARRLGRDPVHLGLGGRAQGRRALPPQHAGELPRRPPRASISAARTRCSTCCRCSTRSGSRSGVVLPLVSGVRIYLYPSPLHYRTVAELIYARERHHHVRHRHLPQRLCAGGHPYDFRSLRYILAGAEPVKEVDAPHLHGEIRAAHSGRLWRHRDRAGAGLEHADVQQVRHRRAHPARHGGAARKGRGRRGGRPPLCARPQRHARLSQGRQSGRAGAAGRKAGTTPATS